MCPPTPPPSRRSVAQLLVGVVLGIATATATAQPVFSTNTYVPTDEDFANPERGFYLHTETRASAHTPVPANLANLRLNGSRDPNNAYIARLSLLLRVYYLDLFVSAPLSSNYLNTIEADLASIRNQGSKVILRFAYFQSPTRPFPEPSKARILEHIGQLAPLFQRHRDVIALLQQGFIGAWGEGYYTDVFSTAGQAFTARNWADRAEIIAALLAAVPPERMIQLRVPQQRQKFLHGPAAPITTAPAAGPPVFETSAAARLGFHNDCFLADATDAGTFINYDGATAPGDVALLRQYQAQETRHTVAGGETCAQNPPDDDCSATGGRADSDLALFHYSFLNQGYNAGVNDDWVAQGCLEEIKRRLGYRFELVTSVLPGKAGAGELLPVQLELRNTGFAAPFNPRGLELIFRAVHDGQRFYAELSRDHDARRWVPGSNHLITASLSLPVDLPPGAYDVLLHLPDPTPSLYGLVPYSLRLANSTALSGGTHLGNVWEPASGYHWLGHTLRVRAAADPAPQPDPESTAIPVLPYSAIRENYDAWRARRFPAPAPAPDGDPAADPDLDAWPNVAEYAAGTDPTSALARPAEASIENGQLLLTVRKAPGTRDVVREIESSADLAPASWSPARVTVVSDTPGLLRVRLEPGGAHGFLRLRVRLTRPPTGR